ncbi:unnamed protein product [[Candida] boidinii]|nr:unnamed protein product [[Candida] boidinii]
MFIVRNDYYLNDLWLKILRLRNHYEYYYGSRRAMLDTHKGLEIDYTNYDTTKHKPAKTFPNDKKSEHTSKLKKFLESAMNLGNKSSNNTTSSSNTTSTTNNTNNNNNSNNNNTSAMSIHRKSIPGEVSSSEQYLNKKGTSNEDKESGADNKVAVKSEGDIKLPKDEQRSHSNKPKPINNDNDNDNDDDGDDKSDNNETTVKSETQTATDRLIQHSCPVLVNQQKTLNSQKCPVTGQEGLCPVHHDFETEQAKLQREGAPLVLTKCPILNPHEATLKYVRPEKKRASHEGHSIGTGLDSPNSGLSSRKDLADDDADDESDYDIDTKVCPLMIGDARTLFKEKLARMSIAAITEPSITHSKEGSPKVTSISAEVTTEVNSPLTLSSSSPLKKSKSNLDSSVASPSGVSTTANSPQVLVLVLVQQQLVQYLVLLLMNKANVLSLDYQTN